MPVSFLELVPFLMLFAGLALAIAVAYHSGILLPRAKSIFKYEPGLDKVFEFVIFAFALSVFFPVLKNSAFLALLAFVVGGGLLFALFFRKSALEGFAAMMVVLVAVNLGG